MLGTSHYVSPIIKGGRGIRRFWFCNTPFSFIFGLLEVNDHRMSMITTTDLSLRSPWKPCDPRRSSNPNSPLHPGRGMMTVCSGLNMNKYIYVICHFPRRSQARGCLYTLAKVSIVRMHICSVLTLLWKAFGDIFCTLLRASIMRDSRNWFVYSRFNAPESPLTSTLYIPTSALVIKIANA